MSWARSGALGALPLMAALAVTPATRAGAAEPRPALDLDRISQREGRFVAPLANGGEAKLTLDPELQLAATKILAGANPVRGGMVVIDARSGEVLAWAESARDGRHHQVLTTSRVPAASVFKLVTTAALFETTSLSPKEPVCISGGMHGIERRQIAVDVVEGGDPHAVKWTLPFDRARACARSMKSSRLIAARNSRVTSFSRADSERRSSRPCLASSPNSTVAAIS